VSYGSVSHLPAEVGSYVATYPTVPYGPHASSIKKSLVGLPMQLGTHVPNVRAHVSKVLDIRVIMGLQDVWAVSAVNAYKACRQIVIVRLQCSTNTMDHSSGIATVPSDSTSRRHTADRV
jgi:hypothetical protein